MFCNFCFWFLLNPVCDCSGHNDTPTHSHCPGGEDHGDDAGHQLNSPIKSSSISVASPSGMCLFFFLIFNLPIWLYPYFCCKFHMCRVRSEMDSSYRYLLFFDVNALFILCMVLT